METILIWTVLVLFISIPQTENIQQEQFYLCLFNYNKSRTMHTKWKNKSKKDDENV